MSRHQTKMSSQIVDWNCSRRNFVGFSFKISEMLPIFGTSFGLHWFGSRYFIWIVFLFPFNGGTISLPVTAFLLSPTKLLWFAICLANYISWEADLDFLTTGNDLSCCHRSAFPGYKPTSLHAPNDPLPTSSPLILSFRLLRLFSSSRILIVLTHL